MLWIYNIVTGFYHQSIKLASWWNPKAKLWVDGRNGVLEKLKEKIDPDASYIWMHCASLGEFEQGRPVLEGIKKKWPDRKILLTFYSPSGYTIRKDYPLADIVCYLPKDNAFNAQQFLKITRPTLAIFVKYEFWFHYLNELKKQAIPRILISAVFRKDQLFFKSWTSFFKEMLLSFEHIFIQNAASEKLLIANEIRNYSLVGDTRIDRVLNIAQQNKAFPMIEAFAKDKKVVILGSSWEKEENILKQFLQSPNAKDFRFIIAPHDVGETNVQRIAALFGTEAVRYLQTNIKSIAQANILIIDTIGLLSSVYRFGHIAFIGGGFGDGIHNTLEPIAFELPVIFGPKFQKFEEANYLQQHGGAFCVKNEREFKEVMLQLSDEQTYQKAAHIAKTYIKTNQGASQKILDWIAQHNK